jgi:hypothetical protein
MEQNQLNMFVQITDSLQQLEDVIHKLILRSESELKFMEDNIAEYIYNAVRLEKYQQSLENRPKEKMSKERLEKIEKMLEEYRKNGSEQNS